MRNLFAVPVLLLAGIAARLQTEGELATATEESVAGEENKHPQGFSSRESKIGYTTTHPPFGGQNSPAGELEEADEIKDPAYRFPKIDAAFKP